MPFDCLKQHERSRAKTPFLKEALRSFAKNRAAVISAIVVVGLIAAGGVTYSGSSTKPPPYPRASWASTAASKPRKSTSRRRSQGALSRLCRRRATWCPAGSVVARLDKAELEAQLQQGQAEGQRARETLARAEADVQARKAELTFAQQELQRAEALVEKGWTTREKYDQRKQQLDSATAALTSATKQIDEAQAAVNAADANVKRLQAQFNDRRSPRQSGAECSIG
jgi:HlyD family secretion protein